ncbi:MAG: Rrf2 family transcriptional regulator [Verrucomicrobia bacterium]|nr:Rrf2 family transcriptional regulator [Verrucomicrobiota bacterium]
MLRCGKTSQTAIAAMSALAERYDGGKTVLSSLDIAKDRNLPQPLVAKLLTTLSTGGLVDGTRGPGGGYWLAKAPSRISLAVIVELFEKENEGIMCPFGPGWCGKGEPCPLHNELAAMDTQWENFMRKTTLAVFAAKK